MNMRKPPPEAKCGRATDRVKEGYGKNRELMDKNRIEVVHGATSCNNTPKAIAMPVEVNPVPVRWSNVPLPRKISRASAPEKSAEVIIVRKTSRGRDGLIGKFLERT